MEILLVSLPVASVILLFVLRIRELKKKRDTVPGTVLEKGTLRAFVLIGNIAVVGSITEYAFFGRGFDAVYFLLGWLLGAGSFLLRAQAIRALGRYWSIYNEIREAHRLVDHGPFAYVRHPTYLSLILELLSIFVFLQAWITPLLLVIPFSITLLIRIRLEEKALIDRLGNEYLDYRRKTPFLLPWKWPK